MSTIYDDLQFPPAPADRPYTFINMVETIDGKTVIGDRGDSVAGLGSKLDQELMDKIERAADAVLLGGQTLRATGKTWNPKAPIRVGLTKSGDVPFDAMFFTAPESKAYVAYPSTASFAVPDTITRLEMGEDSVDVRRLAKYLRESAGVERLHILGGSEVNAQFLHEDLVDELFLTIAPKVKMGRNLPTYAGGEPLPKDKLQSYKLVEHHVVEDEVFLRYRRRPV